MNRFLKAQLAIFCPFKFKFSGENDSMVLICGCFIASVFLFGFDTMNAVYFFVILEIYYFFIIKDIEFQPQTITRRLTFDEFTTLSFYSMLRIPGKTPFKIRQVHLSLFTFGFIMFFLLIQYAKLYVVSLFIGIFGFYYTLCCVKFLAYQLENGEIPREKVFNGTNEVVSKFMFFLSCINLLWAVVAHFLFYDKMLSLVDMFLARPLGKIFFFEDILP